MFSCWKPCPLPLGLRDTLLSPTSSPTHRLNHRWSKWFYVARHRVKGDKRLNGFKFGTRSRRSGGRVLMQLLVCEMHFQKVCREIVFSCFVPIPRMSKEDVGSLTNGYIRSAPLPRISVLRPARVPAGQTGTSTSRTLGYNSLRTEHRRPTFHSQPTTPCGIGWA